MSSSDSGGKKSCMEVDRISYLSPDVLGHILSFIDDPEFAVRTCVISKRWKSVYMDVHRLSFHLPIDADVQKALGFERFVTTFLLMNKHQSLTSFSLKCTSGLPCFGAWLTTVITRKVSFLDLCLRPKGVWDAQLSDTLPSCVFTSKALEKLILSGYLRVRIPGSVSLPRLECLSIDNVEYDCEESARKLITGCPVLKSLCIKRTRYDNVVLFTVFSDVIERLEILAGGFEIITDDLKLEIKSPFLKYLRLCDYVTRKFSFGTLQNLVELHLFDVDDNVDDFLPDGVDREVLFDCEWVQGLVDETADKELKILSVGIEEILDVLAGSRKLFSNLTNLIITSSSWEWTSLLQLLGKAKNLKVLELKNPCRDFNGNYEAEEVPALSNVQKISLISSLTLPETKNFDIDSMVEMVKYVLKHGGSLHQFYISHTYIEAVDLSREGNFRDTLLEFTRKSSHCEVHVVYK